jgi:cellulose biosynthesis protein BcsQ
MTAGAVRLIAVVNMKGGVGKTSTVVSLADALGTATETAVLVLDVDTQANASYCLVGDRIREIISSGRTIDTFLRLSLLEGETPPFGDHITRMVSNTKARSRAAKIALLASSTDLRVSEREILRHLTNAGETLDGVEVRIKNTLQRQLASLDGEFGYVLIDCAPGISPFTAAAIGLADLVIVPTIPDFLSNLGLESFLATIGPNLPQPVAARKPRVLFTRSQARGKKSRIFSLTKRKNELMNVHKTFEDEIRAKAGKAGSIFRVFETTIDETPAMPAAMGMGAVLGKTVTFQQKYPGRLGEQIVALKDELLEALS